jgi:hypothetical protein
LALASDARMRTGPTRYESWVHRLLEKAQGRLI